MIIDAHHHLWTADYPWLRDPSLERIRRDYTVTDLRAVIRGTGVDRTVLIEAGRCDAAETTAFLRLAQQTPEIAGVVGWAGLTDPDLAATIERHRGSPSGHLLVGIRDQVQAEADDHLDRPDVRAGLSTIAAAGLVNELVVRTAQLPSVARAAVALPESTFVLDHLGKPAIAAAGLAAWRELITPVAALPNVVAKLSGLVTEAGWTSWTRGDLRPYVETAVELFGTSRLMFGSDWPVLEVAATYTQVKDALADLLGGLPADVFGGTAIDTYHLELT
ncbi:putative amidohydrolase [Actinoplanes missouriensis 431]|uniref:Putative amidohydrolase n=1 Tax=Actinoplanes missouriensis (strain ATCC 14538 / DSM 43046 / CBS 188.64 / JCM 3121 / NBRC 102363 / NCIMB 12654 / NRRL B-3342 / UNCC 431) TaxID=512565 RepID=I0H596_ACTM4|nr:amidohydrolase family protein [Actinoplanes missouriensis]BAL88183.1 putative amidohydrolase [Actinoplanes missouriensis 431]